MIALNIEKDMLISLLKLTKEGAVLIEKINKDVKAAPNIIKKLIKQLENEGFLSQNNDCVKVDKDNRLGLAARAISLGADFEHVSSFLHWQEFEDITAIALERNGYTTVMNMRFRKERRRWEIDVVGCRNPLVLCIDCKHWQRSMNPSALRKIVKAQVKRTHAFVTTLPNPLIKIECVKWNKAKFVPIILSLLPSRLKFYDNVPIVSVLQLQDFLTQVPAYVESLKCFTKDFSHL